MFRKVFVDNSNNLVYLAESEGFGLAYLVAGGGGYLYDLEDHGVISWFGEGERYETGDEAIKETSRLMAERKASEGL